MGDTNIGWTEKVWNPIRGCERVSEGCKKCYAEVMAARHSYPGGWGEGLAKWVIRPDGKKEARWTGEIRTVEKLLSAPLKWNLPKMVFVNSMTDMFHKDVPEDYIDKIFAVMAIAGQHTFQILTKRPERMHAYCSSDETLGRVAATVAELTQGTGAKIEIEHRKDGLRGIALQNVWLGVSAEDQATFDERVEILGQIPAAVRFVSAEPLLGYIDFGNAFDDPPDGSHFGALGWTIVGGESGPSYRVMEIEHARWIIEQCKLAGKPIFVKQDNGAGPGRQGRFTDEEWALKQYPIQGAPQ